MSTGLWLVALCALSALLWAGLLWLEWHRTPRGRRFIGDTGMSLRDWFAGQALLGALSYNPLRTPEATAEASYRFADAMLEARK